ncbi:hypothetical protein PITCH_A480011 [uncultured Desulfobacterium sp.]|uniref:Uncharacterized protein n=1 Tax=uncultured Desulfobacterium sp. TaxID=201089 RepID=A0A445N0D2_9BACT|nr:hypothetical protein PITCH_A480011 [uncultured Desulfobacterium sp.]
MDIKIPLNLTANNFRICLLALAEAGNTGRLYMELRYYA